MCNDTFGIPCPIPSERLNVPQNGPKLCDTHSRVKPGFSSVSRHVAGTAWNAWNSLELRWKFLPGNFPEKSVESQQESQEESGGVRRSQEGLGRLAKGGFLEAGFFLVLSTWGSLEFPGNVPWGPWKVPGNPKIHPCVGVLWNPQDEGHASHRVT